MKFAKKGVCLWQKVSLKLDDALQSPDTGNL